MGSNAKTDVAAAAQATPRVGTRLLLATHPNFNFFSNLPNSKNNNCQDGRVYDQAELPRGLRSIDQQADQHGILCLVRLSFHELLLQPGRSSPHGFAEHFKTESGEERAHGMKLMEYQTKRGGRVVFQDIAKPTTMEWGTPLEAMEAALELEKTVNQSLLDLHKVAGDKGDGHLCDFLESEYLGEQVEGIKSIGDLITKMKRAGDGLGLHLIDKEMGS